MTGERSAAMYRRHGPSHVCVQAVAVLPARLPISAWLPARAPSPTRRQCGRIRYHLQAISLSGGPCIWACNNERLVTHPRLLLSAEGASVAATHRDHAGLSALLRTATAFRSLAGFRTQTLVPNGGREW